MKMKLTYFINTGYISHRKFWFKSDGKQHDLPYDKLAEAKKEKEDLGKLENHIIEIFNLDNNDGIEISKDRLK